MPTIIEGPTGRRFQFESDIPEARAFELAKQQHPEFFPEEIKAPAPARPDPGITSEIGSILKSGAGQGIAGLGKLGQYAGIGGKDLEEYGAGMTRRATEALSPGTQAALQRQFLQAAPEGQGFLGYQLGDAKLTDIPAQFLQSVPVMAGTMAAAVGATALAPASAVAGVGTGVLGFLGRVGLGKVAGRIVTAAGAEAGAAEALAGKLAINTLAGNVAEGFAAAGSSGIETEKAISDFAKLNPDGFFRSPIGQQALQDADGDKKKAIELGAFRAGRSAAALTGISTAILATPGSAFESLAVFGKGAKSGRLHSAIMGGVTEGPLQELPQGSAEQYIQNLQRIQAGEPISPGKGVLEAGVQGAIIGTPMGGALGAITGSGKAQELPPLDTQFQVLASKYQGNGLNATNAYHTAAKDIEKYAQPGETLTVYDSLGRDTEATIVGKNETGRAIANVHGEEVVLGNEFTVSDPKDGRYGFKKGDEFVASSELNRDEVTAAVDNIRTVIKQFNDEFEQTKVKTPEHYSAERQGTSLDAADAILEAKEKKAQEEAVKPKTAKKPVVQAAPAAATPAAQAVAPAAAQTAAATTEPTAPKVYGSTEDPLMIMRQEDDPNPFPKGMNFAVGNGAYGTLNWFKTVKEAEAYRKDEQDSLDSQLVAPTDAPADIQASIDAATAAGQKATTEQAEEEQTVDEQSAEEIPTASLPANLSGASPRYNSNLKSVTPTFESDVDKAAYIVSGKGKSKQHQAYVDWLSQNAGFTEQQSIDHGKKVRESIKSNFNSAENGKLNIPAVEFPPQSAAKQSRAPKKKSTPAAQNTLRQLLTGMREARNKEYYDKALPRVTALIYKRMNQMGLGKYVSNEFLASIKAGKDVEANGEYVKRLIKLAIAGKSDKQIMSTLDHEAIHAMRAIGMITDEEWKNLKTLVDKRGWMTTFLIQSQYDKNGKLIFEGRYENFNPTNEELKKTGLNREQWILNSQYEEAIADAFSTYANGRSPVLGYDENNQAIYRYKKDLNLAGQPVGIINRILKILGIVKDVVSEDATFKRFVEAPIEADADKLKAETASPKLSVSKADLGREKTGQLYEVYNRKTGKVVGGPYQTRSTARSGADRNDNKYGGYAHDVREVQEFGSDEGPEPTKQDLKKAQEEEKLEALDEAGVSQKFSVAPRLTTKETTKPIWYSELSRQIDKLPQKEMTAAQWKALLINPEETKSRGVRGPDNKVIPGEFITSKIPATSKLPGVKMKEIEDTEILDWLDVAGESFEVDDYIDVLNKKYGVRKEGRITYPGWEDSDLTADELRTLKNEQSGGRKNTKISKDEVQKFLADGGAKIEFQDRVLGDGKWWGQPIGGERRTFTDIDAAAEYAGRGGQAGEITAAEGGNTEFSRYVEPGGKNYREAFVTVPPKISKMSFSEWQASGMVGEFSTEGVVREGGRWVDGHGAYSGIDNPVVRIRFNDRTDVDGNKVLFLEELQPPNNPEFGKMPKTLQGRWLAIGLKRMIRYAADNGYDKVAWTTGEQQVVRYENALRKEVDSIDWEKTSEGVHIKGWKGKRKDAATVEAERVTAVIRREARDVLDRNDNLGFDTVGEALEAIWNARYEWRDRWELNAEDSNAINTYLFNRTNAPPLETLGYGIGEGKVVDTRYAENDLTEVLGKVMADRIRKDPAQTGTIEGKNLTVDSPGVKKLYDVGIPSLANKILKELGGGKVGETTLKDFEHITGMMREAAEAQFKEGIGGLKQPSFDITPALRERAMQGMSRFSVAPRIAKNIVKNNEGYWIYKGELPESFYKWFGNSVVTDKDGFPRVVFHGTARDITEFKPKRANAIFVTDDEEFAEDFSKLSRSWMLSHIDQFITPDRYKELKDEAKKITQADTTKDEVDELDQLIKDELPVGENIMPLFVRAEKPFDYSDKTHLAAVRKELEKNSNFSKQEIDLVLDTVQKGSWRSIEREEVQDAIRAVGFDGFYVKEAGRVNLAVYDPNQVKSVTGNSGEYSRESKDIRRSVAPRLSRTSDVGHKRELTSGRYVGAPDWVGNSPQQLAVLRTKLRRLAMEGEAGRYWYENSSKAIMAMAGGDKVEAERIVSLIALYSPNATVPANTSMALTAYYQWKSGVPIKAGFGDANRKAESLLKNGTVWDGIKTNAFYQNLMEEIDPSKNSEKNATMDMWMAIAFDYGQKNLDQGPKYKFSRREIQSLANKLGWKPHQVQAAIWVAMKSRIDPIRGELRKEEKARGWVRYKAKPIKEEKQKNIENNIASSLFSINPYAGLETDYNQNKSLFEFAEDIKPQHKFDHFKLAHKMGFEYTLKEEDIIAGKYDFSNALSQRSIQMSYETTPGDNTGLLPGAIKAPVKEQMEYLVVMEDALTGKDGKDLIAELAGLPKGIKVYGYSAWEGNIGAGGQMFLPVPLIGVGNKRVIKPEAKKLLDIAAALRGFLFKQKAVVYHVPIYDSSEANSNGADIKTKRALTEDEMRLLYSRLNEKFNTLEIAPGYTQNGARVLNFVDGLDNKTYISGIQEIAESLPSNFGGGIEEIVRYRSEGAYIFNDWEKDTNGENYLEIIRQGRPDILQRLAVLQARVDAVNKEFSKKYEWGNAKISSGEKLSVAPRLGDRGEGREKGGRFAPLKMAPSVKSVHGPDRRIVEVAERYAEENGISLKRQAEYVEVDLRLRLPNPVRGERLANAYVAMLHAPQDPVVKEAYSNLIKQTTAQYRALEAAGYRFWFIDPNIEENLNYLSSPWNAIRDLRANQEMGVFPTTSGYGTNEFDVSNNPMLAQTGIEWPNGGIDGPLKTVLANDLFRAVHDAFGHGLEGAGFRADGEENAFQAHIRMYTGSAKGAITSETRGQNSEVNFGPNAEFNRTANGADTIYADQKIGLMPKWTWTEGIAKDEPEFRELDAEQDAEMFRKAVDRVKRGRKMAFPLHVHDVETYRNARLFLSEDKESGFALMGDEIGSFFSGGGGQAYPTLRLAVEEGGRRIDAYRSIMPKVLGKAGFRPVARVAFDPSQATEIWDYKKFERFQGGTPDLVFFAYDSISKGSEQVEELVKKAPLVQYDEALALQAEAAGAENASGKYSHAMRYPDMLKANWPLVPETNFYRENPDRDDIAIYKGKFIQLPWGDDKKSFGMDHILHNAIRQSNRRWEQVTDKDDENAILGIIDILNAKDLKVFKESPLDNKIIIRSGKFKRAIILGENKDDLRIISVVPSEIPKFGKIIDQTPDVKMSDKVLYQYKNNFTGIKVNFRFETPPATVTVKKTRSYELPKQSIAPKFTLSPYIGATGSLGGSQIPTTFAAPASSKLTDHIYTWADKFVDLKNLQKEIEATIGQLDDQYNALQKEELYHAKVAKQFKDFMRQEVLPLYNAMKEENVTPEKLNEYVHNRHAKERNDQIDKVNQGVVQGIVGKGSGIETQKAKDYLNSLTAQETASLDRVANMLDGIMQKTRALMVSSGLEEQGTIDAWEKTYTYYVPLERVLGDPDETNTGFTGQGQGYSVSKSVKRAMGSTLDVDHIIANILSTRERTIVRAEKNEIDKAIYALAIKAPNPNIWIAVDPELPRNKRKNLASFLATFGGFTIKEAQNIAAFPETRSIDRQTGHVKKGRNPQLAKADNVLHLMIDGKEKLVFFNSRNKQANRLVRTLKNLDTANLARGLQTVGAITRYFSAVNTQYNPIFGVVNLIRDVQTGFINLESTPIAGMQKQVAGDFMPAIKGIWSQLRAEAKGGNGTGPWAALFKEFEEYGGPTGYRDMFANSDDRAKMIESEIKALSQGKARAALSGIGSMLSDYNTAFENGVRLAAYKAARDIRSTLYPRGMSQEQAASLAKNLTVNFNRKGDIALQAGALYAFFNASVQGTARILQTMTRIENGKIVITPLGNKIIRGGLLLGVVQAVALAAAGFDDDNPPQFVREKNIVIPLMNGKYLTVPMPLGFNLLPNLSRNVTEWGMSGFKNTPKRITSLLESVLTGLNPFGGGFSVQTLVPTVIDPVIALYGNTDSFGRKIAREDFSSQRETPGYLRTKDTATPWAKGLSEFLNYASGGTKYMKGALSPTPDQIDYLIGQATGGVGRELGKISQTVSSAATGEELPSTKIPLASRFYGDTEESASQSNKYYTNLSRINAYAAEIKGRIGHPGTGTVSEFIQDVPEARLVPLATATYSAIQKIRKLKKQAIERNLPKERIRQFEKLAQDRMKQFNQRVDAFQR